MAAGIFRASLMRLFEGVVCPDRRLPPEILVPGHRPSQEVKCWALGQAARSGPHSLTSLSAK